MNQTNEALEHLDKSSYKQAQTSALINLIFDNLANREVCPVSHEEWDRIALLIDLASDLIDELGEEIDKALTIEFTRKEPKQ